MAGRRRKARARERRGESETSPSLRLLARLVVATDDALLRGIAEADHGTDVERHLDALRELRDSLTLSAVPLWHPGEILELECWSEPPRPGPDTGEALRRAHLARAFACAALLAATADEGVGYGPDGEHQTLARLLDSVIALTAAVGRQRALADRADGVRFERANMASVGSGPRERRPHRAHRSGASGGRGARSPASRLTGEAPSVRFGTANLD